VSTCSTVISDPDACACILFHIAHCSQLCSHTHFLTRSTLSLVERRKEERYLLILDLISLHVHVNFHCVENIKIKQERKRKRRKKISPTDYISEKKERDQEIEIEELHPEYGDKVDTSSITSSVQVAIVRVRAE